jgi:hypothetical protein
MNERIEHCLYAAGLTAQGCWDELDDYAKEGIGRFAKLIVEECAKLIEPSEEHRREASKFIGDAECVELLDIVAARIKQHFGVEP